tara:strand:- start:224 stop:358 length:135 start_codon:yes stop_codon:yes gene_type:complete
MTNKDEKKTNEELANEIVNLWNNKLDDETQEKFEDRLKEKEEKE